MKKLLLATAILALSIGTASAGCNTYIGSGNCETDSSGNRIITNQNTSGGYTSTTNGYQSSTTSEKLNGGYETKYNDGSSSYSTQDPYGSSNEKKDPLNPYGLN